MIISLTIWFYLVYRTETSIYIFDTHDGLAIESYDCISNYCRRPREPINLTRSNGSVSCDETNGGIKHRFSDLQANNTNVSTILHQWKSSFEQVEAYIRYLNDSSQPDGYVCECSRNNTFGKYCEYRLPIGTTLEDTVKGHIKIKNQNQWKVYSHGNITCYEGINCNSGLLCLDWREICDGTQNCMFGLDEKNCDFLEWNVCDDNEYRCSNGMCIPDEYFLDGELDCLDWTDEMGLKPSEYCSRQQATSQCDDHLCLPNQWSCGDGQCIEDRLAFQTYNHESVCINRRDQYYMCESHSSTIMWTLPNGRCTNNRDFITDSSIDQIDEKQRCEYLLKCTLSQGLNKHCPCVNLTSSCLDLLAKNCSASTIQYPRGSFMATFLFFFFNSSRSPIDSSPNSILINGTVQCRHALVTVIKWIDSFHYSNQSPKRIGKYGFDSIRSHKILIRFDSIRY